MEAFEEVADTFSDNECCTDFFSSRLSSLNLSFTSSCDPAFSFNTSSRSSSLRHCESTAGSTATDCLPPALPLLPAVASTPCGSSGRHVVLARRTSLPSAPDYRARPPRPSIAGSTTEMAPCAAAATGTGAAGAPAMCATAQLAGMKRRSSAEPPDAPPQQQPAEPTSPTSSFASFAAALAAHYFADYGNVPDVPAHIEEIRARGSKRQRVLPADGVAET